MKAKRTNTIKFLTICLAPVIAGAALGASATWDGGGATNELSTPINWTGDIAPVASGDMAIWNGTAPGDLTLTWTGTFGAGPGAIGTSITMAGGQTASLLIGSSSTQPNSNAENFNLGNIDIASGTGAFTFGDGAGFDDVILRNDGTPLANTFTNNSNNTASFGTNVYFNSGGGGERSVTFGGSGNWQVNTALRFSNGPVMNIIKSGSGTLTLSGSNNSGSTPGGTTYAINAGILKVAGSGLLGASTLTGTLANNAAFSFESSASQTISGVVSGTGSFGQTAGSLNLSAVNTYSGPTTLTGGTLTVSGSGSIESTSGITVNGATARYLHASSVASTRNISLTQGTAGGSGAVGAIMVANGTGTVANGNGDSGHLTVDSLTFNGAGAIAVTDDGDASTSGISVAGALVTTPANGQITVNASSSFWNANTTYRLLEAGNFTGALSNFTKGTINGLTSRQSASLVLNGTTLGLLIGGDSPRWSGLDSSNWVVGTTGVNGNWRLVNGATKTDYIQGDVVLFNDQPTNTTVTISAANVSPAVVNFNNSSKNYIINGSFGIAAGTVNKSGSGNVTISTVNSYAGGTTINAGTITLSGSGKLGAPGGSLAVVDGTLNLGSTSQTLGAVSITGEGNIKNGMLTASGLIVSSLFGTAEITSTVDLGSGNLTKTGDGILNLIGSLSTNGIATVGGGTLALGSSGSLTAGGGIVIGGGMLDLGGQTVFTNPITISAASSSGETIVNGSIELAALSVTATTGVTISANIEGSTGIIISGNGAVLFLSGNNSFTGPLDLNSPSTVNINGSNSGGGAINYNSFGTTVSLNAGSYSTSGISANSNSAFRQLNLFGGVLESGGNLYADTLAVSISFNGGTLKCNNAAGITVFDADNLVSVSSGATFDTTGGNITVGNNTHATAAPNPVPKISSPAGGEILLKGGKSLFASVASTGEVKIQDGSTWDLNGQTSSVGGLAGDGSVTSSTSAAVLRVSSTSAHSYSGNINGGSNLSLVKEGVGTQTLAGGVTYQGNTTVIAGVLEVASNSATTFADSSTVNIASGAALHLPNAATDIVASLVLNGVAQPAGFTADSSTAGGYITGSGKIQVAGAAGGYAGWASAKGLTAGVNDGLNQDPDGDGISNLLEYVLGGLPVGAGAANTSILPVQTMDANNVTLTFHRSDLSETDTTQVVQISSNLSTWTDFATLGAATAAPVTVTEDSPSADVDAVSVAIPRTGNAVSGKLFARLRVLKQP